MSVWNVLLVVVISYLIGSIPFGYLVVYLLRKMDVREIESGRTGGTNVMRAVGFIPGLMTGVLDVLKGASTALVVNWLVPGNVWVQVLAALLAIIGHNYSIFLIRRDSSGKLEMHGGAGGATSLGGAIALWPHAWWIIAPLSALVWFLIGHASVATISITVFATLIFIIRASLGLSSWVYVVYGIGALGIVLWALRPNLERLRQGNERVVGLRAMLQKRAEQKDSKSNSEK